MIDPVQEYIANLSPQAFEREVANYLRTQGFDEIRIHGGAGDRGVDITCRDEDGMRVAVQCKRYTAKVGSPAIQSFSGVQRMHRCQRAIFVTSSTFTAPAKRDARDLDIELIDGAQLKDYLAEAAKKKQPALAPVRSTPEVIRPLTRLMLSSFRQDIGFWAIVAILIILIFAEKVFGD